MDRRKLLGLLLVGLLAATAGCSSQGSISMDAVDDESLAEQGSINVTTEDPGQERALVRDAIENGTTTVVDRSPPVDRALPFRHDGGFYDLSYTENGTQQGYAVDIRIDYNASSVDGDVVDLEDLPAVDRAAFERLMDVRGSEDSLDELLQPGYDYGIDLAYSENQTNVSALVTEQEYDAIRADKVYPIDVRSNPETMTVYEYESTLVAESVTEYATTLRERHEFELSGLSDAERDVLGGALNGTNYIEDGDNDGFDSLVDRFQAHQPVVSDGDSGEYVVRYENRVYWVEVRYGSYLDDETG